MTAALRSRRADVLLFFGVVLALAGTGLAVIPAGLGVYYYVGAVLLLTGIAVVGVATRAFDR